VTSSTQAGPKLKRGEKVMEINGGNVVYEILGKEGDFIALTPGGRFSKDIPGLRPLANALVKGGYRVLLWDRPNCGKSDVQFYGKSESHMRAETLHALINGLDIGWTDSEGEDATQRQFHGAGDDWRAKAAASVPMGKLGQVDEIADFVVFLLSDRSGVVTGSIFDWDQAVVGGSD
jgi:hypothetical protein